MGTENKAWPPEVIMWLAIPAEVDAPESMSPPPMNQFVKRIGKDLAHGRTLFEIELGIVPWNNLGKKVKHTSDPHSIFVDRVVLWSETINTALYHARLNVPCQPSKAWSFLTSGFLLPAFCPNP